MKWSQFLLIKLSEECAEVSQRALKQVQFGSTEIQKGQEFTNAQRLKNELLDLLSIAKTLQELNEIPHISQYEIREARKEKIKKLEKYLALSTSLGEIKIND
jgi:hypothetical protein